MIYLSENGTDWQSGENSTLLPFAAYDTTLNPLNDPVNVMIPECRTFVVPACRHKGKTYPDVFKIEKMPGDRLKYQVDFSQFSESIEDDIVQQFFLIDKGATDVTGVELADNKVSFMLSDGSETCYLRLIVDTEGTQRKVVEIQITKN